MYLICWYKITLYSFHGNKYIYNYIQYIIYQVNHVYKTPLKTCKAKLRPPNIFGKQFQETTLISIVNLYLAVKLRSEYKTGIG